MRTKESKQEINICGKWKIHCFVIAL